MSKLSGCMFLCDDRECFKNLASRAVLLGEGWVLLGWPLKFIDCRTCWFVVPHLIANVDCRVVSVEIATVNNLGSL